MSKVKAFNGGPEHIPVSYDIIRIFIQDIALQYKLLLSACVLINSKHN